MLEGLEVSEVLLSELEFSARLDAEYYRPYLLEYENKIRSKSGKILSDISNFLIGPFGSAFTVDNYTEDKSYRYVRGKDVKPMRLMNDDNVYMPKKDYFRLSKYALKENDILISVVGTLGNAAIIHKDNLPAIFSCKSTVLRVKNINPRYLLSYLNSKYGRDLLLRKERGAIQKGLNLDDLKSLDVYVTSNLFQNEISQMVIKSQNKLVESQSLYSQAEELLLEELGLKDWQPSAENINEKSFSESFLSTGRLDAEYYQPKYEDYKDKIRSYHKGFVNIGEEYTHIKDSFTRDQKGYNYIEIGNVNVGDGSCVSNYVLTEDLPANAKIKVKQGDLLISTVRPYRGAVSIVDIDDTDLVVSGAFTVLRKSPTSLFNNEVLKVLLRTNIYKDWLLQFNVGTQYPVIKDEDILNLPIPLLEEDVQLRVYELVQESFTLKRKSEHLLEVAKRAVEIAIEQSEEVAMEYIKENTK